MAESMLAEDPLVISWQASATCFIQETAYGLRII